ncbi:MAG: LytR C-terminal domain-containing protein [Gemmatimonadota bacterium]
MQERILWLLAGLAGVIFLIAGIRPYLASEEPVAAPEERTAAPAGVRVAVLNGCGAPYVAARMTRRARGLGLDVIQEGNAESFGFAESMVVDRSGDLARAEQVARSLGIRHWVQQISHDAYLLQDVDIVIGRDYRRLGLQTP